jgi:hypothetical protein
VMAFDAASAAGSKASSIVLSPGRRASVPRHGRDSRVETREPRGW